MIPLVHHPRYNITALGLERLHPFDIWKYRRIHDALIGRGLRRRREFSRPLPVTWADLMKVHTPEYLRSLRSPEMLARILEVPVARRLPAWAIDWRILRPMRYAAGGTILAWLFRSDVTPSMLGPPLYPERPDSPQGEVEGGHEPHYFDGSDPELGRCYPILVGGEPVGQVSYNGIHERGGRRRTELDIRIRNEACCGRGYGPDALDALCRHLHDRLGVVESLVQPTARNPRAIRAYEGAGFRRLGVPIGEARALWGPSDHDDGVSMVRSFPPEGDGADRP